MKQFILIPLSIALFACSAFEPYKVPIPQGNIIEDEEIANFKRDYLKNKSNTS